MFANKVCLFALLVLICYASSHLLNVKVRSQFRPVISKYVKNRMLENDPGIYEVGGDSDCLNYYFVNVYLGEKKQKASLILDTGSHIMCTTCKQTCKSCGKHENPDYDSNNSKTFSIIDCNSEKCSPFPYNKSCVDNKCAFHIVIFII